MTEYPTSIGTSAPDSITVLGQDLADDLMGKVGFAELAFWLVAMRRPTPGQLRLFEAVLVALADHGLTPTALAARLTLTGAPESVQGALAAGLLGTGSRFLGVTEDTGRFLADALQQHTDDGSALPRTPGEWDELALEAVRSARQDGQLVPGLGHTMHKDGDPRTPVLYELARVEGVTGPHLLLFEAVGRVHPQVLGRTLPMNGAGACGAVLCDLGFEPDILRGFALLARAAGLLGHIAEERRRPIGLRLYADVERHTDYQPPSP
jgi:citrate synthase